MNTSIVELTGGRTPRPRPGLLDIVPYQAGAHNGVSHPNLALLNANENPLGCSPLAAEAVRSSAQRLAVYPDGGAERLRGAISHAFGIDAARIVCGAGSDELLQLLTRGFAGPGDEVLYSQHGFLVYALAARQVGAKPVAAPERNLTADVDALLDTVTPRTRLVMVANPNNPTGSYLPKDELCRLHAGLPPDVVLVVDEAYAEYVTAAEFPDYASGLDVLHDADNVVVTRTFSKIHGLAGLRLGWAFGPKAIIDVIHRLRGPYNVTSPSLAAGEAALADHAFVANSVAHNSRERARLEGMATSRGILGVRSAANFVLLRFLPDAVMAADAGDAALKAHGVVARQLSGYGLPDCLRVTVGESAANDRVIEALGG